MSNRNRPSLVNALALALAALAWTTAGTGNPAGAEPDGAETAIRRLLARQVNDWNRKDLDGFLEGYWHAPGVVFQSGNARTDGFEAMRHRYRSRYQDEGREMGRLAFPGVEVVLLGPDAALARGRWRLTMPDGSRPGGLFTLVLRKFPEGWRIIHDHTSS